MLKVYELGLVVPITTKAMVLVTFSHLSSALKTPLVKRWRPALISLDVHSICRASFLEKANREAAKQREAKADAFVDKLTKDSDWKLFKSQDENYEFGKLLFRVFYLPMLKIALSHLRKRNVR